MRNYSARAASPATISQTVAQAKTKGSSAHRFGLTFSKTLLRGGKTTLSLPSTHNRTILYPNWRFRGNLRRAIVSGMIMHVIRLVSATRGAARPQELGIQRRRGSLAAHPIDAVGRPSIVGPGRFEHGNIDGIG